MEAPRKRKIHRVDRTAKSRSNEAQQNKKPVSSVLKSIVFLSLIGLLAGLLFVLAMPSSYSGPSHKQKSTEPKSAKKVEIEDEIVPDVDNSSSCDALMKEAKQLVELGLTKQDTESALDILASCILKEPENAAARWNLAAALFQLNRIKEGVRFIDEALTLAPQNKQYFLEAGKLFSELKMHKEAIRCLEKYLELSLHASNWPHLLASISIQREDEWTFLYDTDRNIVTTLELLLQQYLRDKESLIKINYLFKVVIGLKGSENALDLVKAYAFFSLGLCDFNNGMNNLHILTEQSYVAQGYGDRERAIDIVSTHALRLFTAGLDGFLTSIARNLLINGENVFNELVFNCDLNLDEEVINYATDVRQADVKHILATCIIGQNVLPVIIENGAVVHTENIFGWSPLLQIISLNSSELVFQILKAGADPQSRTPSSNTALHIAAIKGSTDVVLPLLQAGLKDSTRNVLNQTALDVACSHRWYAKEFAKSLNVVNLPVGCPVPLKYVEPLKQGFKTGGWLTPSLKLPKMLSLEKCDIDVLGYTTIANDVLLDYLVLQKPVLIRNATNPTVLKKIFQFWQRNKIVKEYGHLTFNEIDQPLSEFGLNHPNTTSLKEFLDKMQTIHEEQSTIDNIQYIKSPPYILQTISPDFPMIEHFKTPSALEPSLTEIIPINFQLHIGPALSGISPRFHQSSWNALVFGRRKWVLFPPKFSFYSKQHVWDWWQLQDWNESGIALECVQYPGDVLLIPDMWGYAAINLKESIALSSQFIHGPNEFSL